MEGEKRPQTKGRSSGGRSLSWIDFNRDSEASTAYLDASIAKARLAVRMVVLRSVVVGVA